MKISSKNLKIVVLDSGLGGLSVLRTLYKKLNNINYIYFADTRNLPYGSKTKQELLNLTVKNITNIVYEFNPDMIVFGCNTIGITVFKELNNKFKNINMFALKPNISFALNKGYKNILILATQQTISNIKKVEDYKQNKNRIILCKMPLLATMVENYIKTPIKIVPYLKQMLKKYENIDCIILGCSHYYFIKKQLKTLFKSAKIIDGSKILTNEVSKFIINSETKNNKIINKNSSIKFIITGKNENKTKYEQIIKNIQKSK